MKLSEEDLKRLERIRAECMGSPPKRICPDDVLWLLELLEYALKMSEK